MRIVARIQKWYGLKPRYDRLRKAGMLTVKEMASLLGINAPTHSVGRVLTEALATPKRSSIPAAERQQ